MMKRFSVIVIVLSVTSAGFCADTPSLDDDWVPVPLEEIERMTQRRQEPKPLSVEQETAPQAKTKPTAEPAPETQPAPSVTSAEEESYTRPAPKSRLTPEEIARRLRSNRSSPVVPARGAKSVRKIDPSIAREGQAVAGRIGRIELDEHGEYVVKFENNRSLPYQSPRQLLPCRLLEEVETHWKENPNARYRLSGETTNDGKNIYLLLSRVAVVDEGVTDVEPDEPPAKDTATQPVTQPAEDTTTSLISQMLQDRPGKAVKITPTPRRKAEENVQSVAPAGRKPFTPGKQDLVVDRIIRVIREPDSEWWLARFESDNTLREPPLRILPGLRLVWIQMKMDESGESDMLLRVSGEITYYKGKRYLMLRKVLRQRDLNEFQ